MASITINIPDEIQNRVINALCNGDTPSASKAKQIIIKNIKDIVIAYEYRQLAKTERLKVQNAEQLATTAINAIVPTLDSEITLT